MAVIVFASNIAFIILTPKDSLRKKTADYVQFKQREPDCYDNFR
jgi:hypothetical protein